MINIGKILRLTQNQGHKVKGQGQIRKFVKKLFRLYITNERLDIDDTHTHNCYQ